MNAETTELQSPNLTQQDETPTFLRVLVYGASTTIGTEIVRALALFGHEVIAADIEDVQHLEGRNVTVNHFDLTDKKALKIAVQNVNAIVCALYPARSTFNFAPTFRFSNAVRILSDTGVCRLVLTSSAATDDPGLFQNVLRWADVDTHIDLARMETVVLEQKYKCDFTIVRLPMLTNDSNRAFVVEEDKVKKGWFRIGVKDAAIFVVRELEQRKWIHRFPVPTYA